MDGLEMYALRRQNLQLARRLELIEAILERAGIVDAVLGGDQGPQVDPSPVDTGRLADVVLGRSSATAAAAGLGGWVGDPSPDDPGWGGRFNQFFFNRPIRIPIPRPGDPAPIDLSRFNKVQLETTLHSIAAKKARLESMEGLVKEQIANLGKG